MPAVADNPFALVMGDASSPSTQDEDVSIESQTSDTSNPFALVMGEPEQRTDVPSAATARPPEGTISRVGQTQLREEAAAKRKAERADQPIETVTLSEGQTVTGTPAETAAFQKADEEEQARKAQPVQWADKETTVGDIERVARQNKTSPAAIKHLGTPLGQFESRLAKSAVGQGALRFQSGVESIAEGALDVASEYGIMPAKVGDNVRQQRAARKEFLELAERGGDVQTMLGETGSQIYNSLAETGGSMIVPGAAVRTFAGRKSAAAAVYSIMAANSQSNKLEEGRALGLEGAELQSYATRATAWELAITAGMGRIMDRLGLDSLEESVSRGVQNAVGKVASRIGLPAKIAAGSAGEAGEEVLVELGQQWIRNAELPKEKRKYDPQALLVAAGAGALASGGVQISQAFKQNKKWIGETVKGAVKAEEALQRAGTDDPMVAPHLLETLTTATHSAADFAQITGLKRTSKAFRESFTDTLAVYQGEPVADVRTVEPRAVMSSVSTTQLAKKGGGEFKRAEFTTPDGEKLNAITFSETDNAVQIELTQKIPDKHRGTGVGLAEYEALIQHAASVGKSLESDITVSADAARVYEALEKRGYKVTRNKLAFFDKNEGHWSVPATETSVFMVDTSVNPSVMSNVQADTGVQILADLPTPPLPPPGVRPSLAWDTHGTLVIPDVDKIVPPEARDLHAGGRALVELFTQSIEQRLKTVAARSPAHQKFKAEAVAEQVIEHGQRVLRTARQIGGKLHKQFDKVVRQAGRAKFTNAALEAQSDGERVDMGNGIVGGDTVVQQVMEGQRDLSTVSPELAAWAQDAIALNDARGQVAEGLGLRRPVPQRRLADRLTELGQMSDTFMEAHFRALLPKHKVPTGSARRAKMIEKLQRVEFFQNHGGKVWQRLALPAMNDIRSVGVGHPLWEPLAAVIAKKTGQPVADVKKDMRTHLLSAEKKHAIEIPRELSWMPAWIEVNGRRTWLLETHPYTHANRTHESFTLRMGNISVFGDPLIEPAVKGKRTTQQDRMRDEAVRSGLDPYVVDAYFNGLAGLHLDRGIVGPGGEGIGKEGHRAIRPLKAVYNTLLALKLTTSAPYSAVEPFGLMRRVGGLKRVLKAYDMQIRRGKHEAVAADIRRAGAFVDEYANFTFDRASFLTGLSRQMSDVALRAALVKPFWNQNAEISALIGWQMARDFENGIASKWDRDALVRDLGYTKDEAAAFYDRTATQNDYDGLIQRFAARTTTAKITNPTEEAGIRTADWFRAGIPFSRYALLKSQEAANILRSMKANWQAHMQGDAEAKGRMGRDLYQVFDWGIGGAMTGLASNLLRHLIFYGPEEGWGLWVEELTPTTENPFRPMKAALSGMIANQLGFIGGNAYWAMQKDDIYEAVMSISPGTDVVVEGLQAAGSIANIETRSGLGFGRYKKAASGLDVFTMWLAAMTPGARTAWEYTGDLPVVGKYLAPLAFGSRDQELDTAKVRMFRWLDEQGFGPMNGAPREGTPEQNNFVRYMRAFQLEARKEEPMSDERRQVLQSHLEAAFGTRTKRPNEIRERILDMRLLHYLPNEETRRKFRAEFPERYKKLEQHDRALQAWASWVYQP